MIAELGLAVLWMAAALAILQLFAAVVTLRPGGAALGAMVRPLAVMQGVFVALAFAALITLFLQTDLSVKLVAENNLYLPIVVKSGEELSIWGVVTYNLHKLY